MDKIDALLERARLNELLNRKEEPKKKCSPVVWVLAVIGIVAVVAGLVYFLYQKFGSGCDEFMDDDFDDFDEDDEEEDIFEDESIPVTNY